MFMNNKIAEFFERFGGFIIGAIVGILVILCNIIDIIVPILIVIAFGLLGAYIQKNKLKVKEVLKNLIEKW